MTDNINVTPGSGKIVAADDVGGIMFQRVKIGIGADGVADDLAFGQKTKSASLPVVIASDSDPLTIQSNSSAHDVTVTITRPADTTAYAAGDLVSGALLFTAAGKTGGAAALVVGVQLEMDIATVPGTAFRLHLYSVTPPSNLADNAAFDIPAGDRASYLGYVDITAPQKFGATVYAEVNNVGKQIKLTSANCYGYLQTAGAYTPAASDVYKVTLHTVEV